MESEEFEKIVQEEYDRIPEKWKEAMKNVAILTEDEPDIETRREQKLGKNETLLGLYRGVPSTERGDYYGVGVTLPDSITLYRLPILEEANDDPVHARIIIRETLWHEIAHHFGFSEDAVYHREKEKTNKFKREK